MGGLISVIICVLAAVAFYGTGYPVLFWLSVVLGVLAFWSWGIMHNHATESSKLRHDIILENMRLEGRTQEDIDRFDVRIISPGPSDVDAVPNWLAVLNMIATFAGLLLLVWGAIVRFL